ncbi:GTP 3',8-cyclase MoaA [Sphingomonas sp. ASY06-1R]|jgi:cyclic pyranopterin phosphate synthase|uniref:GTP 3',8-cyclase MoaA n=1 Tax=Sphingomonas sp. ASY06-1R TaxID=3445771 RepID=UPI003FA2780A
MPASNLVDRHGRRIDYLRVSVTDRCDLRCRYCMSEHMTFLPRDQLMGRSEISAIVERFIARGVRKVRITGGEPLVRRDILELLRDLGAHVGMGLEELTLTTNGTQLARYAAGLRSAGVKRINVSLDTCDPDIFRQITRRGDLDKVLQGLAAAKESGLAVKINMVVLKGLNDAEVPEMLRWCGVQGFDLSLIETMPLGAVDEDRVDRFVPLTAILERLSAAFDLVRDAHRTSGPARYWRSPWGTRLGLISPLTANFCDGCNRVRLTTEGKLYMCLGHEDAVDLRQALRQDGVQGLDAAIDYALANKPARHQFQIQRGSAPAVARHMSVTGG